jgi:uncharacterized protein (DUF2141 family)
LNTLLKALTGLIFLGTVLACARVGTPPGGPLDEDAPVVTKSKPFNYSTNYNRKNILITFDEYVTLTNVFTEFTISPPLKDGPMPYVRGKGIVINLNATELDSLTYTMDFGQSIADNNEGNLLPNFQFVVSKQTYIDSFSVSGKVLDAFTHVADKDGLFVYLYNNFSDTVPFTSTPSYLAKTTAEGMYTINHIASGTYNIFVLKDVNTNMLFDMPTEVIGFASDPVYLYPDSFPSEPDLSQIKAISEENNFDSLKVDRHQVAIDSSILSNSGKTNYADGAGMKNQTNKADTAQTDSLKLMVYGYYVNLFSFIEPIVSKQFLSDYQRPRPEKIELLFNSPLDSLPQLKLLIPETSENWYLLEKNRTLDTLVYWLPDSSLILNDSLVVAVEYPKSDSAGKLVSTIDTLVFQSNIKIETDDDNEGRKRTGIKLPFGKKEEIVDTLPKKEPRLPFKHNISLQQHDLYRSIIITPEVPVFDYRPELIKVFRKEDTLEIPLKFNFIVDSTKLRKATIEIGFESDAAYTLKLYEGAFTDIYGRTIDTTTFNFRTQRDDYYGMVNLQMQGITAPTIVQLLGKDEVVVKQRVLYSNEKIFFDFLKPEKYTLKVIIDGNDNGKWDTGVYKLKQQPEQVEYFPKVLDVKSNWTLDYEWDLKK